MLVKEWFGSGQFFLDDECGDVRLLPEEWECASDLGVAVDLSAVLLFSKDDLLKFNEVGNVTILINAAMQESRTSTLSSPPCNQDQVKLILHALSVNETLHQVRAPKLGNALRCDRLKHVSIPREVILDDLFARETMLLI